MPAFAPRAVYPRMRGEHDYVTVKPDLDNGLSPHARGTSTQRYSGLTGIRFIPACAGNMMVSARNWSWLAVYPRMRGEHPACDKPCI